MDEMHPVGGNWCWISSNRADLRYSMAHGWRICVIFGTVAIYLYIWVYLRRKLRRDTGASLSFKRSKRKGFRTMDEGDLELELDAFRRPELNARAATTAAFAPPRSPRHNKVEELDAEPGRGSEAGANAPKEGIMRHRPTSSKVGAEVNIPITLNDLFIEASQTTQSQPGERQVSILQSNASEFRMRPNTHQVELEVKRMLLLNAYPFMYVLLWAPGLINRLMEASGNPNSKTVNAALQAPTQFIGLANALTYGFNHYLRDRLNDLYWRPMITRMKNRLGLH
ncbi:cyclic AMP receptor 2 [Fusarium beomiforme]|uniref:Cyclic AMP receptor 2 n=1 Tax=Fusarium beomiforme TaxID=44412 RepID=A0A9P5DSZ6_9HYPO|nr:cyclic AMP receptor 2 [Fusarium beomiforme]